MNAADDLAEREAHEGYAPSPRRPARLYRDHTIDGGTASYGY